MQVYIVQFGKVQVLVHVSFSVDSVRGYDAGRYGGQAQKCSLIKYGLAGESEAIGHSSELHIRRGQ